MTEAGTKAPPAVGTVCWNELLTRDPEASRKFYTELFGWTTEEMDMGPHGKYTLWKSGDKQVGGLGHTFAVVFFVERICGKSK